MSIRVARATVYSICCSECGAEAREGETLVHFKKCKAPPVRLVVVGERSAVTLDPTQPEKKK